MRQPNNPPQGLFPVARSWLKNPAQWTRATGEYRDVKAGEHFLSGAIIEAYKANDDLGPGQPYWIAELVELVECPHCKGKGKVVKDG